MLDALLTDPQRAAAGRCAAWTPRPSRADGAESRPTLARRPGESPLPRRSEAVRRHVVDRGEARRAWPRLHRLIETHSSARGGSTEHSNDVSGWAHGRRSTWRSPRRGSRLGDLRSARSARRGERAAAGRISRRGDDDRRQLVSRTAGGAPTSDDRSAPAGSGRNRLVAPPSLRGVPGHRRARRHHAAVTRSPGRSRNAGPTPVRHLWPAAKPEARTPEARRVAIASVGFREPRFGSRLAGRSGCMTRVGDAASIGMFRIVACVSALTWASQSAAPHQFGDDEAGTAFQHLLELVVGGHPLRVLVAERAGTLEQIALDLVEQVRARASTRPSIATPAFSRVSRRASTTCDFSMSLGPISSRSGTPRSSHSENFQPGRSSRSSSVTRMPAVDELVLDLERARQHRLAPVLAADRHDHHLVRRHCAAAAPARCRRRAS